MKNKEDKIITLIVAFSIISTYILLGLIHPLLANGVFFCILFRETNIIMKRKCCLKQREEDEIEIDELGEEITELGCEIIQLREELENCERN